MAVGLMPGSWLELDDTCMVRGHRRLPRGAQVFFCDPPAGAVGLTADQPNALGTAPG